MKKSQRVFNLQSGHKYMVERLCSMFYFWKRINSKSRQTRLTVHKFRTSSYRALNMCEVPLKYPEQFATQSGY